MAPPKAPPSAAEKLLKTRGENFHTNVVRLNNPENQDAPNAIVVNVVASCKFDIQIDAARMSQCRPTNGFHMNKRQFASLKTGIGGWSLTEKSVHTAIFDDKKQSDEDARTRALVEDAVEQAHAQVSKPHVTRKRRRTGSIGGASSRGDKNEISGLVSKDALQLVAQEAPPVEARNDVPVEAGVVDATVPPPEESGNRSDEEDEVEDDDEDDDEISTDGGPMFRDRYAEVALRSRGVPVVRLTSTARRRCAKININGAASPMHANLVAWLAAKFMSDHGMPATVRRFRVTNIVATLGVGFWVDPLQLIERTGGLVNYDPERITMVRVKYPEHKLVCLVAPQSGRVVISSGRRLHDIAAGAAWVYRLCSGCRGIGPPPDAQLLRDAYKNRLLEIEDYGFTEQAIQRQRNSLLNWREEQNELHRLEASAQRVGLAIDEEALTHLSQEDMRTLYQLLDVSEARDETQLLEAAQCIDRIGGAA